MEEKLPFGNLSLFLHLKKIMKETYYIQPSDSVAKTQSPPPQVNKVDSIRHTNTHTNKSETIPIKLVQAPKITETKNSIEPLQIIDTLAIADTLPKKQIAKKPEFVNFTLYPTYAGKDSSIVTIGTHKLTTSFQKKQAHFTGPKGLFMGESGYKSWILFIGLLCLFVLIIIRTNFQKYLDLVINSLLNYQLAEKLMREKNVLIRRAFLLLNLNYILSFSMFFYLVIFRYNISFWGLGEFGKFFILLLLFFGLLLLRLFIINIVAAIFDSKSVFREYIHISYLLNKNLGLYLLPVVFSTFFVNPTIASILFYFAIIIIVISLILKYIRSIQLILKHKVFLFYSILYLCTFEILPALVGLKIVLSLR